MFDRTKFNFFQLHMEKMTTLSIFFKQNYVNFHYFLLKLVNVPNTNRNIFLNKKHVLVFKWSFIIAEMSAFFLIWLVLDHFSAIFAITSRLWRADRICARAFEWRLPFFPQVSQRFLSPSPIPSSLVRVWPLGSRICPALKQKGSWFL